ncbi:RNA polymerase II mediator complex subunit sin4-like protein [Phlyctema vagabunda]|uniref:Mediator of RNA polymerase II transcription subunit 16 n=1 Tax=Phlyctema vagabunda TaxID=108571 RepID=A0ABR4PY37_9HELO
MPLMEDDMDVDINDLFGDGTDLALPSRPPPAKELHQRIDELRGSGCCQSIAWSKWGSIASIHPNGTTLEFRNLRCHPDDGSWALSEPSETPQLTMDFDGGPLKHLSWSPNGAELAVIDSCGRITILLLSNSINKPTLSRQCHADQPDDLHAVAGCLWLNNSPHPNNRNSIAYGPAVKDGSAFKYESTQAPIHGPYHPINTKSAFVCVTTNGILRVLYPQVNGKWNDTQQELESIVSSEDLITHASIKPDKTNILLIAFATASKQLRTVRALVDFGNQEAIKKVQQGTAPINAMIRTRHVAVTSWLHEGPTLNASHTEPSMVQLSHLDIMQPIGDPNNRLATSVILAVRSHLPISTSHYNQDVHTTIDRWEVREKPQTIHPAFEQLSSRRNSIGNQPGTTGFLKKLQSITINKIVIGVQPIQLGKYICFTYSDGSVDYRDRNTMAEVFVDDDFKRVTHLTQIGFSFSPQEPCPFVLTQWLENSALISAGLQTAISPTSCSMVQIGNDNKVKWRQLEYQVGDLSSSLEDDQYNAMVAAFTTASASAVVTGANIDDILATLKYINKDSLVFDWPSELTRMLKSNVDYSEEAHYDPLIRNTVIQLCLSIQVSLGFNGEFLPRSFAGKFGWVVLQLRSIVVLVTMAANVKVPPGPNNGKGMSPLENPEVLNALAGSVRWALDLMAWITDTLLALSNSMPSLKSTSELSLPMLMAHLRSTNNIAPHLLICSATRGFLNALCRRLTHLDWVARCGINHTPRAPAQAPRDSNGNIIIENPITPALRAAYIQIATLTSTATVNISTFEKLLSSLGSSIKMAYNTAQIPSTSPNQPSGIRNALELKMLFGGDFPNALQPAVVELFATLLPATREEIDPGKLFFQDFSSLEVDDDDGLEGGKGRQMAKRREQGMTMDSFSKRWLPNPKHLPSSKDSANGNHATSNSGGKARWRRCARCTAVMEDILNQKATFQWLVMQHRRCFCSGQWDTLQPGQMAA